MNFTKASTYVFLLLSFLCFISCEKEKDKLDNQESESYSTGFYTIETDCLDDWDEGVYYHDKDNDAQSYYIVSQTDTTDNSVLLCLSLAKNTDADDAVLFHLDEDMSIKDVFLAGYTFEAHPNENDVLFIVYDKDYNVVGNFNVAYKTVSNESRQVMNKAPSFSRKSKSYFGKILDFGGFLNNAAEIIGNVNNLADGKYGDVVFDYAIGKLVEMAGKKLPWYVAKLSADKLRKFIQEHYNTFQNHFLGSAEIEITTIKRESETTIRVDGIITNASSIPESRLTTQGYTHNYVFWGVAMGRSGYPGVYLNDNRTDLTQAYIVQQSDNKFSCTFYQETVPGQVYYFRPFLAPEATVGADEGLQPTLATCIRYGERKSFLDVEVELKNFKQTGCKKEGNSYIVKFTIDGSIPGTFNELSNWGFDLMTKTGSYKNRYYAKESDTYFPPTSKQFECEVKVSRQDIEDYDTERIAPITLTPFVMYWNQLPPMDFLEQKECTLTITDGDCPDSNHPHWIDLGLPSGTQWRCCNEGASSPEAYGGYYTFGQVSGAPTLDQIKELLNYCTSVWTTLNGVNGREFTGPNGGTIFLPAAGHPWEGGFYYVGSLGHYWSSTPFDSVGVYYLSFSSDLAYWNTGVWDYDWRRDYELSVRPVR